MPVQCYSSIALAVLLLVLSVINGSWEGVGASLVLGAVGAALVACVRRRRVDYGFASHWLGVRPAVVLGRRMEREPPAGAKVFGMAIRQVVPIPMASATPFCQ